MLRKRAAVHEGNESCAHCGGSSKPTGVSGFVDPTNVYLVDRWVGFSVSCADGRKSQMRSVQVAILRT